MGQEKGGLMNNQFKIPVPDWDRRVDIDIAHGMLRQSNWGSTAGVSLPTYFDIDDLFAVDYRLSVNDQANLTRKAFIRQVESLVEGVIQKHGIDRVAFIDKGGMGPLGSIWLALITAIELNVKLLLVRPWKELISARIKGEAPQPNEKVLIFTDVVTTGGTVIDVANVLKDYGAKAVATFAIIERDDATILDKRKEIIGDKMPIYYWKKASDIMGLVKEN